MGEKAQATKLKLKLLSVSNLAERFTLPLFYGESASADSTKIVTTEIYPGNTLWLPKSLLSGDAITHILES